MSIWGINQRVFCGGYAFAGMKNTKGGQKMEYPAFRGIFRVNRMSDLLLEVVCIGPGRLYKLTIGIDLRIHDVGSVIRRDGRKRDRISCYCAGVRRVGVCCHLRRDDKIVVGTGSTCH
jgi:hypothetical protein